MKDVIEAEEYVRTENGKIDKVVSNNYYMEKYIEAEKDFIFCDSIVKHSKQIIDLIEVGDIVNGMEVLDIHKPRDLWEPIEIKVDSRYTNFILAEDIKTILTKESYMANCYKIGGEDGIKTTYRGNI